MTINLEEEFYSLLGLTKGININAFENNWPYILQATRSGLLMKRGDKSIIYFAKRATLDQMCVVNMLGPKGKDLVVELAKEEKAKGKTVLVKNIYISELPCWAERGFKESTDPWSKYSFRDDNTFPQCNISKETILKKAFSWRISRELKKFSLTRKITTEPYDPANDLKARNLLNDFAVYSQDKGNDYSEEIVRGHLFFFDESIKNKLRLQHIENGELIGFSFLTPVGSVIFYNALICKNESNLMKYLISEAPQYAIGKYPNAKICSLQGSEIVGQDYLKRRLKPIEMIEKTHIVSM